MFPPIDVAKSTVDIFLRTNRLKDIYSILSYHVEAVTLLTRSETTEEAVVHLMPGLPKKASKANADWQQAMAEVVKIEKE